MDQRQRILDYVPGHTLQNPNHVRRVLLQVFGMAGHGKSAMINSSLCVVMGDQPYQNVARSASSHEEVTKARQEYPLTPKLVMVDNRGLNKLNEAEKLEINAQFRQLRSLGEVTWSEKNLIESIRQFKQQEGTRQEDFIVPVFVYSCYREWNCMEGDVIKNIFTSVHQITGIQPIVVITRCSLGNWKKIEAKFVEFGCTHIVAMENYTENNQTRTRETDENVLKLLTMCIEEAETGIGKLAKQDPSRRPIKMMMGQIDQDLELLRKTKLKYKTFMK
ncbi:hypothetical protein AB205_0158420 [Aquarana catesbeiana]|uniref:G domain-containing protein n=1 Tax=Aquarana catesbeiana TaxID=8400 RepID=A0A2G9RYV4_AQUCT|nr:hypothetical protein AB205_0158420 [Aquarana catesbeiana]